MTSETGQESVTREPAAKLPEEYRGIRGASTAVRLKKKALVQGRGQESLPGSEELPSMGELEEASPKTRDARTLPAGSAQEPDQSQPQGTAIANIFEAARAARIPETGGAAPTGSALPGLPAQDMPLPGQEQAPLPSLDQARAQAFAMRAPTRRKLEGKLPATAPDNLPAGQPQPGGESPFSQGTIPEDNSSNARGFLSFLLSILLPSPNEQKADRSVWAMLGDLISGKKQQTMGQRSSTMANQSLFSALDAPLAGLTPDDIQYAGDVDAAYSRRPKFGARFLSLTTIVFFAILLVWAAVSEIDEVTHSEGSVVGSQSTQTISNLEGGILRAMLVRDGTTVQKGDVIAQIDNEMAASSYRDAMQRSMDNVFAIVRLEAELAGTEPAFPADLVAWAHDYFGREPDPGLLQQAQQIVNDQRSVWRSRKERFQVDEQVLRTQAAQREREIQEQTTHREQLVASLAISKQQRDAARQLVQRNNFSRLEYLGMEQRVVELQGQVDMLATSIARAQAAADEARHRIESHSAEFRSAVSEEINKRRVELTTLQETLAAGGDRVTRTDVRSPVRGIIKQIYINTIGGVIKPGEPILDIVPLDDTLLVEARVRPQDVAFLRPGQDVMVKVTAYDFSIYGGLEGKLEQISADTIEGKQGEFYYLVKIRTSRTYLEHNNEILPIIPGMIVQADILIGKKTILSYLMKPILKAKQNALTER